MTTLQDQQLAHCLSRALYQYDPMNTGCGVNEGMEDEYLNQATDIVQHLSEGVLLRDALIRTFDYWFWEGCLLEDQRQAILSALLASLTAIVQDKEA